MAMEGAQENKGGPEMAKFAEKAPDLMAELMRQFIERKNLVDRAKIRLQVKALQDFFSADTKYPPVPAISADQMARRRGMQPQLQAYVGGAGFEGPNAGRRAGGEVEELQRQIEEAVHQEQQAGVPPLPDVAPAPGAPVAVVAPAGAAAEDDG